MPNKIDRQKLKKRMLDRWENEGGRIAANSTVAHEVNPGSNRQSEGNRSPTSLDNVKVGTAAAPTKKRKRAQK